MYLHYPTKLDSSDRSGLHRDIHGQKSFVSGAHYDELTLDCAGNIIAVQFSLETVSHYTRDEIVGKNISVFYPPQDIEEGVFISDLQRAFEKNEFTTLGQRVDRNKRFFLARMDFFSFKNAVGEIMGYRVKLSDVGNLSKATQMPSTHAPYPPFGFSKLPIPTRSGFVFVEFKEIVRCQSDINYTIFYLLDGSKIVSSKSLSQFESLLTTVSFLRVHKSDVINLVHLKCYTKGDGGSVTMTDNTEITVSRTFKPSLIARLNLHSSEK